MSLSRQFFREMRPLFRILESPFATRRFPVSRGSGISPTQFENSAFAPFGIFEPLLSSSGLPAIDVKEESNVFVVEAELPGVKKDNVALSIGDDNQSVTIEARTVRGTAEQPAEVESNKKPETSTGNSSEQQVDTSSTTIASERIFAGESSFSRTIWLPRRVDPSGVSAKLQDGILTVRIPKAEEQAGVKINIE